MDDDKLGVYNLVQKTCTTQRGAQLSICIIIGMGSYKTGISSSEFSVNFSIGMDSYCIGNRCFGVLFIWFSK